MAMAALPEAELEASLFESMEGSSFLPVDWVNQLVDSCSSSSENDDVLLNSVRSAQTRLQTRSQELSRDAERLMDRLLSVGPRAAQELDRVERDASTLKKDLKRVQEESGTSSGGGASTGPFSTLKSLDTIKTNLERCVHILQETGSWSVLVREMESFFAARNLGEVASRLAVMKQSADTLSAFPGNPERQDMLERMEQRLESLVRPGLTQALDQAGTGEWEGLKQSVIVFTKLNRTEALLHDLGASRGQLVFDACWGDSADYSRFLDKVLARFREVELPLCEFAFADSPELVGDALSVVARGCFTRVSGDKLRRVCGTCEVYVAAHLASDQFASDLGLSLLKTPGELRSSALTAVGQAFRELDVQYLEWEAREMISMLKTKQEHPNGSSEFLQPDEQDRLALEMNPGDLLDLLCDECVSRCGKIHVGKSWIPISMLYAEHLSAPIFGATSGVEARNRLKLVVLLKTRFIQCVRLAEEDDLDVLAVKRRLETLLAEARGLLFASFVTPALELLDQGVKENSDDAITRCVDHLYSLIPLLEFDFCTADFVADSVLGGGEREELAVALGGRVLVRSSSTESFTENVDDLPRAISASWLEAVARAMCTAFVLRVTRLPLISDAAAMRLGSDADSLEKNAGSVLAQGERWDPALGVARVVLSAEPGLTHLKLGNPMAFLDDRYCLEEGNVEPLKALEHMLVGLRNRRGD